MSDYTKGRDLELMGRGWEFNPASGLYRKDGVWWERSAARQQEGLDAPPAPEPPKVEQQVTKPGDIIITDLRLNAHTIVFEAGGIRSESVVFTPTAVGSMRFTSGLTFAIDAPLTSDEHAQLQRLLDQIARRIAKEIG